MYLASFIMGQSLIAHPLGGPCADSSASGEHERPPLAHHHVRPHRTEHRHLSLHPLEHRSPATQTRRDPPAPAHPGSNASGVEYHPRVRGICRAREKGERSSLGTSGQSISKGSGPVGCTVALARRPRHSSITNGGSLSAVRGSRALLHPRHLRVRSGASPPRLLRDRELSACWLAPLDW